MRSSSGLFLAVLLGATLAAGCSDDDGSDGDDPNTAKGAETSEPASESPPPPPPEKGRCYRLDAQQVRAAHVDADPVGCKRPHTSQTYLVGNLRGKVVRTADTVDSAAITEKVDERCAEKFGDHVGGDSDTRTLARVGYVWFVPSEEEFGRGANWFRCDVVGNPQGDEPARLPADARSMLDGDDVLDTWGTCDQTQGRLNAEPQWRMCVQPHNWRAVSVVSLGKSGTSWPGADPLRSRADTCESSVRNHLDDQTGALEFRWSYPTERQWRAGRHYGLCWTREG